MELFSITVQTRISGVQCGLTYKTEKAMHDAVRYIQKGIAAAPMPLELTDDWNGLLTIDAADILFVRCSSILYDLRRNCEHQYEQAHANMKLQRKIQADPLLTPAAQGGLVTRANQ